MTFRRQLVLTFEVSLLTVSVDCLDLRPVQSFARALTMSLYTQSFSQLVSQSVSLTHTPRRAAPASGQRHIR